MNEQKRVDLYVWMDSNGNNINPDKFWRRGSVYNTTYTIADIDRELDANLETNIGCILIGCGVNDVETRDGIEVANDMFGTIQRIRKDHPDTTIVLGEVTPFAEREEEVNTCNEVLRERFRDDEMVFMVKMDYLKDPTWSHFKADKKHIKQSSTPLFAGGYIAGLRRAHNLPPTNQRRKNASVGNRRTDYLSARNDDTYHNDRSTGTFNQRRQHDERERNEPPPLMQNILSEPKLVPTNQRMLYPPPQQYHPQDAMTNNDSQKLLAPTTKHTAFNSNQSNQFQPMHPPSPHHQSRRTNNNFFSDHQYFTPSVKKNQPPISERLAKLADPDIGDPKAKLIAHIAQLSNVLNLM